MIVELKIPDVHVYVHILNEDSELTAKVLELEKKLGASTDKLGNAVDAAREGT